MKCIVKSCNNEQHEGTFIGKVCAPCLEYAFAVKYNNEHLKPWHFTKGVMPDIREQLAEVFNEVETPPNLPCNKVLDKIKEKYI